MPSTTVTSRRFTSTPVDLSNARSLAGYLPAWQAAHTAVERRSVARRAFLDGEKGIAAYFVAALERHDGPQAARVCERQFATLTQFGGVL